MEELRRSGGGEAGAFSSAPEQDPVEEEPEQRHQEERQVDPERTLAPPEPGELELGPGPGIHQPLPRGHAARFHGDPDDAGVVSKSSQVRVRSFQTRHHACASRWRTT